MNDNELLRKIGNIDDDIIEKCAVKKRKRRPVFQILRLAAATITVFSVLTTNILYTVHNSPTYPGSEIHYSKYLGKNSKIVSDKELLYNIPVPLDEKSHSDSNPPFDYSKPAEDNAPSGLNIIFVNREDFQNAVNSAKEYNFNTGNPGLNRIEHIDYHIGFELVPDLLSTTQYIVNSSFVASEYTSANSKALIELYRGFQSYEDVEKLWASLYGNENCTVRKINGFYTVVSYVDEENLYQYYWNQEHNSIFAYYSADLIEAYGEEVLLKAQITAMNVS